MRPRVGLRNLVSRLKQVVLPAPLGPINAWIVPRSTRRLTSRTATKPANSLVRPSVSRTMSSAIERANSPLARLLSQALWQRSRGRAAYITSLVRAMRATAFRSAARISAQSENRLGSVSQRSSRAQEHDRRRGELQQHAEHERRRVAAR